jgi:hypothetical protein
VAGLPGAGQMTAPPLKPASFAPTPPSPDPKPVPDKPATNVTGAQDPATAPISLLPQPDPPAPDPPAPKKPGPGSGGLY